MRNEQEREVWAKLCPVALVPPKGKREAAEIIANVLLLLDLKPTKYQTLNRDESEWTGVTTTLWITIHLPCSGSKGSQGSLPRRARCHAGLTSPLSFLICWLNSFPSRHRKSSPGGMMPHLDAMARAVLMLSPVTMRTVMPARWHLVIASGTCAWCRQKPFQIQPRAGKAKLQHGGYTWPWKLFHLHYQ